MEKRSGNPNEENEDDLIGWFYLSPQGMYKPFPDHVTQQTEDTYKMYLQTGSHILFESEMASRDYIINVKDGIQINKKTRQKRAIKRESIGTASSLENKYGLQKKGGNQQKGAIQKMIWQFQSDKGWQEYTKEEQQSLTLDYANYEQNSAQNQKQMNMNGFTYEINFEKMTQTNILFNKKRNMRRVKAPN